MRGFLLVVCGLIPAIGAGCNTLNATRLSHDPASGEQKGAKTLFAWQIGPKEKTDGDQNGAEHKANGADRPGNGENEGEKGKGPDDGKKGNGGAAEKSNGKSNGNDNEEPEKPDEIVTDRPDFTEASSTVGKGRIQLEAGYTFSRDQDSGTHSHSYPEALLRVGMFADWFEFRIGQNFSHTRVFGATDTFTINGGEDLYLGVKLGLTEQKKFLPESALILQTTVPTGRPGLTAGRMLPGINYLYGWDLNDFLSLGGSTQGNSAVDDNGHAYLELAQSFTVGYSLTKKLGAYTEFFALFPHGATAPDTVAQYYFNGGFTYKFTPNFQYDIRAGVGLNRHADDLFAGTGFAFRY